jgi:hypothetical protein
MKRSACSIWPYRDWVIRASTRTCLSTSSRRADRRRPVAERHAGQIIATGFHRNTMLNEEGGSIRWSRFYSMVDRVHVTATTWLV